MIIEQFTVAGAVYVDPFTYASIKNKELSYDWE